MRIYGWVNIWNFVNFGQIFFVIYFLFLRANKTIYFKSFHSFVTSHRHFKTLNNLQRSTKSHLSSVPKSDSIVARTPSFSSSSILRISSALFTPNFFQLLLQKHSHQPEIQYAFHSVTSRSRKSNSFFIMDRTSSFPQVCIFFILFTSVMCYILLIINSVVFFSLFLLNTVTLYTFYLKINNFVRCKLNYL